jgi:hypothetical protein
MRKFYAMLFGIALASCSQTGGTSLAPAGPLSGTGPSLAQPLGAGPPLTPGIVRDNGYKLLYSFDRSHGAGGSTSDAGLTS